MEFLPARRKKRNALVINDPQPFTNLADLWGTTAQMAIVGIFVLLLVACLYLGRAILLPVLSAVLIGTTFAPVIRRAQQHGVPPWITAVALVLLMLAAASLIVTMLAAPVVEWIGKASEISTKFQQHLYVLERPLAALHELETALMPAAPPVTVESSKISMVTPVVEAVTPALAQSVVFFATLIFVMSGQIDLRRHLAAFFTTHEGKLRFIRIVNDIEHNIVSYVGIVTVINGVLGMLVALGARLLGLPSPLILGLLAMLLNYVPYLGPACMAVTLLAVGLVTFPSFGQALIAPALFVTMTTLEGHIITPTVLGRHLTLNPLAVFLAIAFWTWLWGPLGAFLAVPLLIIALVILGHLLPSDEGKLPG